METILNTEKALGPTQKMRPPHLASSDVVDVHEVWGDTVKLRNLVLALIVSVSTSLCFYFGGRALLGLWVHDLPLLKAYAMLIGICGCLVAGVVCALLFKPQRKVVEEVFDERARDEVMAQLAAEPGGLGDLDKLPPYVQAEMKQLGIYEMFRKYEDRIRSDQAQSGAERASATGAQ